MHRSHRNFFLLGLLLLFSVMFLFIYYQNRYKPLPPKPPVASYRIPASDSISNPYTLLYSFDNFRFAELLSSEKSHSGKYSMKVKGTDEFSLLIQKPIAEIPWQHFAEARFGAWIFGNNIKGKLVFQIVSIANFLKYSTEINTDENIRDNQWQFISGKAEFINYNSASTDIVKVYFCNQSNSEVFIDDVMMTFGKQNLKGNQSLTDMTSKGYVFHQSADHPPYPTYFAENTFVNGSLSINSTDGKDALILNSNDSFLSGRFIPSTNNADQILLIRTHVPTALLWYNPDKKQFYFKKVELKLNDPFPNSAKSVVADINGDGMDEFIYLPGDTSRMQVYAFNKVKGNSDCIFNGNCPVERVIIQISRIKIHCSKKEHLLALAMNGEAFLLSFEKNNWQKKSLGFLTKGSEISQENNMVCGNFISKESNNILILLRDGRSHQCYYKLFDFDPVAGNNSCLQQGNFDNKCDTLYPDNTYFTVDLDGDENSELISLNSSWRFDMKLISFTEKGYNIISNIDFKGYEKDYNPKYYENLMLCAGYYPGRKSFSIFTLCSNSSPSPGLPDCLGLYSLSIPETFFPK